MTINFFSLLHKNVVIYEFKSSHKTVRLIPYLLAWLMMVLQLPYTPLFSTGWTECSSFPLKIPHFSGIFSPFRFKILHVSGGIFFFLLSSRDKFQMPFQKLVFPQFFCTFREQKNLAEFFWIKSHWPRLISQLKISYFY